MKYRETLICSKEEVVQNLMQVVSQLSRNKLMVESVAVEIPSDKELEYKVKYENDEYEGQLSVKVSWVNAERPEDMEDEDEEEEVEPEEFEAVEEEEEEE